MASDNDDWLQRFLQAGILPEQDSQNPTQDATRSTPQAANYPEPNLGIPSPFQALMTMTNNNPSRFFGAYSQAGNDMGAERAATLQRERIAQLAGRQLPQKVPSPARQSAPPVSRPMSRPAYQQTQVVPPSHQRSAAQSASPVRQPAPQPAYGRAYRPVPQSTAQAISQLSPESRKRALLQLATQNRTPPESAHQPAIESVAAAAYRPAQRASQPPSQLLHQPISRTAAQQLPQRSLQQIPGAGHPPRPQQAHGAAPQPARQAGPWEPYQAPQSTFQPHRPIPPQTPQSIAQLAFQSAPQVAYHSIPELAPPLARQSMPRPAFDGPTSEISTPANIAPSLLQKPIQPPPATITPAPRAPRYSNDQYRPTKKRRVENGSVEARPESQRPKQRTKPNLSAYKYTPSNKGSLRDRSDIIQPFDEIDAAEKVVYDSNTIARDVLIAVGQHPTEPRLNYHLQHLQDLFVAVNASADLETFRWDVVESHAHATQPLGAKPPASVKPQRPPSINRPPPQMQPLNTIQQPTEAPKLVSEHPQAQPTSSLKPRPSINLPSKLSQTLVLPTKSPQPVNPPTRLPAANPPNHSPPVNSPNHAPPVNPPTNPPPVNPPKQPLTAKLSEQSSAATPPKQSLAVGLTKEPSTADPSKQLLAAGAPQQTLAVELPTQPPPISPPKQPPSIDTAQQKPTVELPKGERPRVQVEVPAPPKGFSRLVSKSKMVGKRQPLRAPEPKIEVHVSYPVFACKWKNCQAELHNLDVLKQHVLKVHIPFHVNCEWAECKNKETLAAVKLYDHVKTQHIGPIAWKLGDGPSVPATVGSEISASPELWARPGVSQPGEEDSLIFPASYSTIRAFNRVHNKNSPQEKAAEILKAVQRLKERIGVGLDPGGCELATPARNERVSNDEEVYELVGGS